MGDLDLTGSILDITDFGATDGSYQIFSATGTITGTPTLGNVPQGLGASVDVSQRSCHPDHCHHGGGRSAGAHQLPTRRGDWSCHHFRINRWMGSLLLWKAVRIYCLKKRFPAPQSATDQ